MAERRNLAQRRLDTTEGADTNTLDEIQLTGDKVEEMEESKEEKKSPFSGQKLTREKVQDYSRWLDRNAPGNRYERVKVPYKTILIAFIFLVVGSILLYLGFGELMASGHTQEAYEKIVLGCILFIPGSFHSFLAFQALRGVEGWDYEHLTVFENDKFFDQD